ncbi:MAG: citrate synthase [Magnetococcus sp. YQC-3]
MSTQTITIRDNRTRREAEFPIVQGSDGPDAIDIRHLHRELQLLTLDPGFHSTASCLSRITFVDGEAGTLLYRGYPIEQLVEKCDYLEVCYLLLNGELPERTQNSEFRHVVSRHTMVHEQLLKFYAGYRQDAHPMAIVLGVVGALSAFYHDSLDVQDPMHRLISAFRIIAKMPTIAAKAYKHYTGQPFVYPRNDLGYVENFLHMLFAVPSEEYVVSPVLAKALDRFMILHADHEQTVSTATVRLAGSSRANPFGSISAGVGSLWGLDAHGSVSEAVLQMLQEIGTEERIPEFIKRVKDPDSHCQLLGFGHRVYKNYDPRTRILREIAREVLHEVGRSDDPLLRIAITLEEFASQDDYCVQNQLCPNIDFYSGLILSAMGIPPNMFTVIFAVARCVGWIAQWNEMIATNDGIARPRQVYIGPTCRDIPPAYARV